MRVACVDQPNGALEISISTHQTLAPNFNESIQIDDFLFAIQTLAEFEMSSNDELRN